MHILKDCRANILVIEDVKMAEKILEVRNELPDLKVVVLFQSSSSLKLTDVITWNELIKLGDSIKDESSLKSRQSKMAINQCAMLVYTSGTTGMPKGLTI